MSFMIEVAGVSEEAEYPNFRTRTKSHATKPRASISIIFMNAQVLSKY